MDERLMQLVEEEARLCQETQAVNRRLSELLRRVYASREEAERAEAEVRDLEEQQRELVAQVARLRYSIGEYPSKAVREAQAAVQQVRRGR